MVTLTPETSPDKRELTGPNHVQKYKSSCRYSSGDRSEGAVESILAGIGLDEACVELFAEKGIDADTFRILEEDDLVEMGVRDAAVRARIMEAVRNCQLRRAAQSPSQRQFSVVDGTRILVGCANQLDTLCNLLKYARHRLGQRPAVDQYLHGRYAASEGARDVALALLTRARRLHGDLHQLQGLTAQAGEKPRPAVRLPGPHDHRASRLLTAALVVFPVVVALAVWKMRASPFRT